MTSPSSCRADSSSSTRVFRRTDRSRKSPPDAGSGTIAPGVAGRTHLVLTNTSMTVGSQEPAAASDAGELVRQLAARSRALDRAFGQNSDTGIQPWVRVEFHSHQGGPGRTTA